MKVEENQIQKINPQQIKKIANNKISNPPNKRKNSKKNKLLISKTLSMENISTGQKYTARQKSTISGKIFNNSAEDYDYLNFSDIDIDLIKKISSCEKDIFKPELYPKNQDNNNDIVQNRYNMIDTSFDTNQKDDIINKSVDEYIDINNNIIIKTPSTICNYYDIDSGQKNIKNNVIKEKKKNKQIKISNNCVLNYNNPIYTHRTKPLKYNSSSSIKILQNSKKVYNNTNSGLNKNKKSAININSKRTRIKPKEIMTPIIKDKNKVIQIQTNNNKINSQQKVTNNNLVKSFIDSNKKNNNKTNSNKNKKYLSIKQYSDYISSQVIKRDKQDKKNSNCNFTFNNDITQYLKKKQNIQDLFNSIKEIKENININLNQNTLDESRENKKAKKQKPIMLYLNKPKYSSYFKTPKYLNSDKKGKKCLNSVEKHKEDHLGNNNTILSNCTGRNYQKSCETTRRDIVVIRKKKKNKSCLINDCTKSINSKIDSDIVNNNSNSNKINITFHNYINDCLDKPIIKVNLKKHIKSSSQLIKFINVNSKSNKNKTKESIKPKNSGCFSSNKSFVSACTKKTVNASQLIKELLTKRHLLKSPAQSKNNNSMLKISKTSKENSAMFINRTKTTKTKSSTTKKVETNSSLKKKHLVGGGTKKFYSKKYENTKNNGSNKLDRNTKNKLYNKNTKSKNYAIPKTQSDIKVNKFNKKEENKENILINENEEYGMDKRVKQKLIDRMNKVTKNTFGNIWGNKKKNDSISEIIKSPFINKEYSNTHKNFYNKRIISNENSKNDEKDYKYDNNAIEKRNQIEFKIIKDYKGAQTFTNNFFNL